MSKKSKSPDATLGGIRCGGLIYLVSFVLVLGLSLTNVTNAQNQIRNWEFDEPFVTGSGGDVNTQWWLWESGNFTGLSVVQEAGLSGDNAMKVEIPAGASDPLEVYQSFLKLEQGVTYTISFMAKADAPRTISVNLMGRTLYSWQTFWIESDIQLTTEPQVFTFEYTHTGATVGGTGNFNDDIDFRFNHSGNDVDAYYDHIWLGVGPPPLPVTTIVSATKPSPANGAEDVPRDVVLSWQPGNFAAPTNGHKVYFGQSFNDANDPTGAAAQDANSYTPPQRLDFGTTYYWRVDEVNAPPTSQIEFKSEIWQFTTEPFAYAIENITATASSTHQADTGPENTINGSGMDVNDLHSIEPTEMWLSAEEPNAWIEYEFDKVYKLHEMWVWNSNGMMEFILGIGIKDVTIEYSTNGTDYTTLGTTHEFARAPGAPDYAHNTTVDFGGAVAKFVRLTANSNWGDLMPQYGLSEVRFFHIPVLAREPSPNSGTTDVAVDVTLGFRAGREADKHDVYLSTDEQAVIDGNAPVTTVTENSYGPLSLDLGKTYYWMINEVNEAETTTTWQGDIWNFSTHEFFVVDDFEDYNDWPPDEIWSTWVDGYGVLTNGATVGYPNPDWNQGEHFAETTIVHGGSQAMPFFYSNTGGATYSEGKRTFAVPQDWTKAGVQTLALYFYGTAGNTGQLYVEVNGSKVVYDGDAGNLARAGWQACNIELASFGTNLQNVTTLTIGIDGNGATGTLYFDDFRLYARGREFVTPAEPDSASLIGHWKLDEGSGTTAQDSSGLGNDGILGGDPQWVAGFKGGALDLDGIDDYVAIDGVADDITTNIFTLTAWIKTTQTGEGNVFASNSGGSHDLLFGVKSGNVYLDDGSETQFPPAVNDDQWHFIAYARDGATAYIYVDGALRGTDPATDDPASDTRWSIGQEWDSSDSSDPSDEYTGMVDEVRFYNYALSYDEVAWLAGWTEPFDKPF